MFPPLGPMDATQLSPQLSCPFTGRLAMVSLIFQLMGDLKGVTCPSGPQFPELY